MPHSSPITNTSPQITSVEEPMRIPAWRSASPKNFITRNVATSRTMVPPNLMISPKASIQPLGVIRRSFTRAAPGLWRWVPRSARRSLDDRGDLGVGGQQRLGERVVEREHPHEGDDHRLVDGAPHPLGASGR